MVTEKPQGKKKQAKKNCSSSFVFSCGKGSWIMPMGRDHFVKFKLCGFVYVTFQTIKGSQ